MSRPLQFPEGYRVNHLKILRKSSKRGKQRQVLWEVQCLYKRAGKICGRIVLLPSGCLSPNSDKRRHNCGCMQKDPRFRKLMRAKVRGCLLMGGIGDWE